MAHVAPFVIPPARGLTGSSLGFHAYSLRVDNVTNQWFQEGSTLTWIPPYSLGMVVKLFGVAVALLANSAPPGQVQPAPIAGEYAVAVYSDEFRTENPGVGVRQFSLVQAVSDLTEGPMPAFPPVGTDRIWADAAGNIHHLHSNGQDFILYDINQPLGGVLTGFLPNPGMAAGAAAANVGALAGVLTGALPAPGMAAGAAAANVGALGGVLSGTLPNPQLSILTPKLLASALVTTPVASINLAGWGAPDVANGMLLMTLARSDWTGGAQEWTYLQINNDAAADYDIMRWYLAGATWTNGSIAAAGSFCIGLMTGGTSPVQMFGSSYFFINFAGKTDTQAMFEGGGVAMGPNQGTTATYTTALLGGQWHGAGNQITNVRWSPGIGNFVPGTRIAVYGFQ